MTTNATETARSWRAAETQQELVDRIIRSMPKEQRLAHERCERSTGRALRALQTARSLTSNVLTRRRIQGAIDVLIGQKVAAERED